MSSDPAQPARASETETPEDETRGGGPPDVIYLPDLSQPERPRRSGRKGRHFGPRPAADPRSERFEIRCTPALLETLRTKSQDAGLSASAYVCALIDGTPGPRAHHSKPGPGAANTARIMAALGRSGNNLNQLLQRVNAYDFRGIPELLDMVEAMKAAHAAHHELVAAIKAELGV